jgi:two-component system, OmpR family, phosphate regulon sensor histidine kinase PhoR
MIHWSMSESASPPQPVAAPHHWAEDWACILTGAAASAILLLLVGIGALDPGPGLGSVALVAAVTFLLERRVRAEARTQLPPLPAAAVTDDQATALAAALEALPYPLMVISALEPDEIVGGRIIFANAAAEESLRLQSAGQPLVTAVRIPEVLEVVDEALFGRVAADAAYETGGAQDRFCRALARPLPPTGDGAQLALLMIIDETDARRNERMRSDFLANASHELRTPLASLAGFIETLRGHARDDEAARTRFLEIMAGQAERMSRLVADLLSLSRIELNEHIPPAGKVDLAMAATDVIDALAPQAAEAGVTLRPQLAARGDAVITADRDQILQVIQNLVDNGVKYAGRGGEVIIEVTGGLPAHEAIAPRSVDAARLSLLVPDHSDANYAVVRIKDSGPGIAREHLPRLTERFYRVEGQKSGERLGTGLGLAIVKHIMNRHRGGLAVETAKGEGCAFLAYFPAAN